MTSFRRQVQLRPRHDVVCHVGGHAGQAEPAQHAPEAHLDADELEARVGRPHQGDVGNSREAAPDDVDDLGVENVPHEQDFIVGERVDVRMRRQVEFFAEHNCRVPEVDDGGPRQKEVRSSPSTLHQDSADESGPGMSVETDREIHDVTDERAVGVEHGLTGLLTKPQRARTRIRRIRERSAGRCPIRTWKSRVPGCHCADVVSLGSSARSVVFRWTKS